MSEKVKITLSRLRAMSVAEISERVRAGGFSVEIAGRHAFDVVTPLNSLDRRFLDLSQHVSETVAAGFRRKLEALRVDEVFGPDKVPDVVREAARSVPVQPEPEPAPDPVAKARRGKPQPKGKGKGKAAKQVGHGAARTARPAPAPAPAPSIMSAEAEPAADHGPSQIFERPVHEFEPIVHDFRQTDSAHDHLEVEPFPENTLSGGEGLPGDPPLIGGEGADLSLRHADDDESGAALEDDLISAVAGANAGYDESSDPAYNDAALREDQLAAEELAIIPPPENDEGWLPEDDDIPDADPNKEEEEEYASNGSIVRSMARFGRR